MIYALSILFPPSTSGALRLRLSAFITVSIIVTFSDFLLISTTTDNTLNEIMGSTTLFNTLIATIPLVLCLPHPPIEHLVRRNRFPTQWYYRHGASVRISSVKRNRMRFLLLIRLVRSIPQRFLIASISVLIDKFYASQDGPPNGPQQLLMRTFLRNGLMPSKTPLRPGSSP